MTLRSQLAWLMVLVPVATVATFVVFPTVPLGIGLGQIAVGVVFPILLGLQPKVVWPLCGRRAGVRLVRSFVFGAGLVPAGLFARTEAEALSRVAVGGLTLAFLLVLWRLLDRAVRLQRDPQTLLWFLPVGEGGPGMDAVNGRTAADRDAEARGEEDGWDWTGSGGAGFGNGFFGGDGFSGGDDADGGDGGGDGGD